MDTCTKNHEKFVDFDRCANLIDELHTKLNDDQSVADDFQLRSETERLVDTFKKAIDKYQEQPELLEPYLAELIEKLTAPLSDKANQKAGNRYHTTFKFLYQLIKVVGFKSIGRRFPHETDKLPLLIDLLSREDPQDKLNWQTRYVLLVWLSIVILTPFDLAKFDSDPASPKTADQVYLILMKSLGNHDSCQHVTSYCLARFFSRPDMLRDDKHLVAFISSSLEELANVKSVASSTDDIKPIGHLRTLAYMYKFVPREELKKRSGPVLEGLLKLDIEKINRELVNHLAIKLIQRVGMSLLPKRIASWRHKRGARILGRQTSETSSSQQQQGSSADKREGQDGEGEEEDNNEEEVNSAELLESILSVLFVAAQNAQTKIRWSAAKGIARLASRLSRERASDVIDTVLENYFDPVSSSEFAWHGGSLTLAEMSRQGLILEEKLNDVTRVVGQAIIYDKIKGSFAVGAHVRESACYVFWAMSRTYEDHLLEPYIPSISINLLCTMLFDRELQCRRAASATFQELVGRQGTFNEEGISILTNVDYQSVGIRQFAYLELATQVARFGNKYYEPFISHLLDRKLAHWDVQIRRLASDSLGALMLFPDHAFVKSSVVPKLSQMCLQQVDNNCKHGAILGLAKVIRSLVPLGYQFDQDLIDLVGSMGKRCEKQLKSKQQAPNFIEAITSLILSSEVAGFTFSEELLKQWEQLILQALDSDNGELRQNGSEALLTLYRYFYKKNKSAQDRLLTTLNKSLQSPNESTRCGALRSLAKLGLALSDSLAPLVGTHCQVGARAAATTNQTTVTGAAPPQPAEAVVPNFKQTGGEVRLDSDTPDIILMSLTSYIGKETQEKETGLVFAQAKAEACEALVSFIKTLDKARLIISGQWLRVGLDVLLEKTEDYTFDKRGDIGVVVRRAAIRALQDLSLFLLSLNMSSILLQGDMAQQQQQQQKQQQQQLQQYQHANRLSMIISKILQQAVSYNNSAREQAALAFFRVIQACAQQAHEQGNDDQKQVARVPHQEEILQLFEKYQVTSSSNSSSEGPTDGETFNWRDESTPIFVSLLSKPEYSRDLWVGLLPAVGQASDLCAKEFRNALSDYIQSLEENNKEQLEFVFESFLATLEQPGLNGRLVTNGLNVADYLLTQGLMNEASPEFQARLVRFCWSARGQNDPKRLVSVGRVLCSMLQFGGPIQVLCLKHLLALLLNGYSKVRIYTAEQLYASLMTYQTDLEENLSTALEQFQGEVVDRKQGGQVDSVGAANQKAGAAAAAAAASGMSRDAVGEEKQLDLAGAMELLSQTNWSEPLEKVKPVRDQICAALSLARIVV